jgi:hypothetical protein
MQVEYILEGRLAVRQKQIDALTPESGATYGGGGPLRHREEMRDHLVLQVVQVGRVPLGHDEEVAGVDRLDRGRHKRPIVLVDDACRSAASHDLAEDTWLR